MFGNKKKTQDADSVTADRRQKVVNSNNDDFVSKKMSISSQFQSDCARSIYTTPRLSNFRKDYMLNSLYSSSEYDTTNLLTGQDWNILNKFVYLVDLCENLAKKSTKNLKGMGLHIDSQFKSGCDNLV